ncbi:diguanylate cyclase [Arthrobacter sp. YA7-1]|jgi:diguanylate cyclase (GGDEF)-like protein/PAS domain S-box-containing protein|uniref:diguanylate cyclase domain-containing protein n=1 Tax=Arthrobacter sp. YA7-1 TaxID=2987701 RepID=UPI002227E54C|nr:diguanylate cyclase [Arthrobacter sp. YA7-1]UYY82015.1 diguanylate cyclase [Arthrobacter sp. YA7-1]
MTDGTVDYRQIFDAAPAGYLLTRPDGTIVDANRTMYEWTGRGQEALLGLNLLSLLPAGDRIMFLTHAIPAIESNGSVKELAVEILAANGERLPVLLAVSRTRKPDAFDTAAPELNVVVVFGVHERRLYERELAATLRRLEESELERAKLLEEARHQATHDALTHLPNRTLLTSRLDEALERAGNHGLHVGLLFCDINRFKDINDTYGHAVGDEVLGHVAGRLADAVRGVDTVARYSGDEFVILLPALESPEEIAVIASRILNSFDPECIAGESQLRVELAVGQAVTAAMRPMLPEAREELARQLLMEADADMYRSKPRAASKLETSHAM